MSRFKLFAIAQMMLAAAFSNGGRQLDEKDAASDVNRRFNGVLFGGSHIPSRLPNQRQRRKRAAQMR